MSSSNDDPEKDPFLPPMIRVGDIIAPKAPLAMEAIPDEKETLMDMAVKLAGTVARFNTDWAAKQLHLSMPLTRQLLAVISQEGFIEELWSTGQGSSHYKITQQGRDLAVRLVEVCGYVGPTPVPLDVYSAMLRWQFSTTPQVKPEHVTAALSGLVLANKAAQMAGLAVSSGRSLFVFGPPGNGKSSLGRKIHAGRQANPNAPGVPIDPDSAEVQQLKSAAEASSVCSTSIATIRRTSNRISRTPSTSAGYGFGDRWWSSVVS